MSRSRRVARPRDDVDLWTIVDAWSEDALDPVPLRARWSGRAVLRRGVDQFIDADGDADEIKAALTEADVRARPIRPERRAIGRTGVAYPEDDELTDVLRSADIDFRVVVHARRYLWRGPFTGPTYCDISTDREGAMTVDAWYQPVWVDGLRMRGKGLQDETPNRPRRVQQARAAINRLLVDLDIEPIRT